MRDDLNRLHIELDYGEIVNFNNHYFTFSASEENFQKYNKNINWLINYFACSFIKIPWGKY
jgi:hypothetical protein